MTLLPTGGFSNSGVTKDIEVWGADPLHRP